MGTEFKNRTSDNKPNSPRRQLINNNILYIGTADDTDVATSDAKWQIERIYTDSNDQLVEEFAAEGEFTQVWDDVLSITDYPNQTASPSTGNSEETLQFSENVGVAQISRPAVAGNDIIQFSLRNRLSNSVGDLVQYSLDSGTTFTDLDKGEVFDFAPKGVTQIILKSNLADTAFDLAITRKK